MLDTGIDVPEVLNLVFFKPVRSKSKFWQMIGRGTRLRPDLFGPGQDKRDFLVFDVCGNLEFFSQDLPASEGRVQPSLTERIFAARVSLVATIGDADPDLRASTAETLHAAVAGMNLDNFLVRRHRRAVERFADRAAWGKLTPDDADLAASLAGLPTAVRDDDDAKRFDLLILRRQLAQLDGDQAHAERLRATIQELAQWLLANTAIPAIAAQAELLERIADDGWWAHVTLGELELVRLRLRGLIRIPAKTRRDPVYADLEDVLGEAEEIGLPGLTPGVDFERFRAKARAYLRDHEDDLAVQRLRRGRALTASDLEALERMLVDAGADSAALARVDAEGLGVFIRSLVGLDRAAVQEAFERYLDGTRFSVDQVRFVTLIVEELTRNGVMSPGRLYESPYTDHAPAGPGSIFPEAEVDALVSILRAFNATAEPDEAA